MKYRQKSIRCECGDPGCPVCHGQCNRLATAVVFRVDMEDETGTRMCHACSQDAAESGLFRERPVRVHLKPKYRSNDVQGVLQNILQNGGDEADLRILADALEESNYHDAKILGRLRRGDATALLYLHLD